MNVFVGEWVSTAHVGVAKVVESGNDSNYVSVEYFDGDSPYRGPFNGFDMKLADPIIDVDFTDDSPFSGVYAEKEDKIYWGNGTVWERATTD